MTRTLAAFASAAFVALAAGNASAQDLEPPPPMATAPPPPAYTPSSDESQDSGLGLEWVYLNADVGGAYTNLQSLSNSNLALQQTSSAGPAFGLAAGVRLLFFTLGVRARDLQLSDFNLWELNGEAAFHIRIWRIDPYFGVRGGYAFVGSLGSGAVSLAQGSSTSDVSVHGINVGPMVGLDVYLSHLVSLGVDANAEFLFLQRPPVPLPPLPPGTTLSSQQQQLYSLSGSSVGFGAVLTAHLGIHF